MIVTIPRGTELSFPACCCCCLAPTFNTRTVGYSSTATGMGYRETITASIKVPFCEECTRHDEGMRRKVVIIPMCLWGILSIASFPFFDLFFSSSDFSGNAQVVYMILSGCTIAAVIAVVTLVLYKTTIMSNWRKNNPGHSSPTGNCKLLGLDGIEFASDKYGQMFIEANPGRVRAAR
ncbi:MAG: hypothetical protein AB1521_07915 [Bacteroidota bacterium]